MQCRYTASIAAMRSPFRRQSDEGAVVPEREFGGFPVVDRLGAAFDTIRESGLGVGIYRVGSHDEIDHLDGDAVVLVAAYDACELESAASTIARHPTVVLGVGLGEHHASRALTLGALGFLHDGLGPAAVKERFSDALARHHYRRLRTARPLSA